MKEYGDWCQSERVPQLTNLNHKNFSDLAVSQTVKKPIPIISVVGTLCVAIADRLSARSTAVLKEWCARALVKQLTLKSASTVASFELWLTDAGWSTFLAHTGDSGSGERHPAIPCVCFGEESVIKVLCKSIPLVLAAGVYSIVRVIGGCTAFEQLTFSSTKPLHKADALRAAFRTAHDGTFLTDEWRQRVVAQHRCDDTNGHCSHRHITDIEDFKVHALDFLMPLLEDTETP